MNAAVRKVKHQHPTFMRAVLADARVTMAYRSEGRELTSRRDAIVQILRLVWVSDAFLAQICYRAKARLQALRVPVLPRLFHRLAMMTSQVCIGDPVLIEPGVYLPHGQVVIDGFVRIGPGAVLFPWVTIGLAAGDFQGPTLGSDVHVGTGAKIIGPITVGAGARIGANAVVVRNVAAGGTVVGVPAHRSADRSSDAKLATAERAIECGQIREAIDVLTESNRRHASVPVERRLAQLRHEGFLALEHRAPSISWPPSANDLFPEVEGIPEIASTELSVDTLRAGILGHGALIVRGLLGTDRCTKLRESIPLAFRAYDQFESGVDDPENPWYWPLQPTSGIVERTWLRGGGGVLAADSPRILFDLLDAIESTPLPGVLSAHFGERPALSVKKTTLREVPPDTNTSWHQDGAFLGEGIRTVNVWIALSPCGIDAPSLDIVPRRLDHIVPTGIDGAVFDWSVSDSSAERAAGEHSIVRPIFETGDAILFDEMNLHRTGAGPGLTKPRYAVEMWFFAPSTYPMAQLPLLF
jgi:serine acetyltransferase